MLPPIKAGGYIVNAKMKDLLRNGAIAPHASNLGGLIAAGIAEPAGIPAYIYDGVSSDEFEPIARITGIPEILRYSFCHVLNSKAVARKYAESLGKRYEEISVIVAHLGGGVTFSAHKGGRIIDSLADDTGAFSPERAGSLPVLPLIDVIYDHPDIPKKDMMRKIRGMGGLKALLGTSDAVEIERRIEAGDEYAKLCYDAMIYQFAKGIGLLAPTLKGELDAVIITGGLAKAPYIVDKLIDYVKFLGHVEVIKGEFENEALALGGLRILRGEEQPHVMV
jgi:butyrate kinase